MTTRKPPSILDVADAAGVSKSSASRALLNQGGVTADTRERVIRAARSLGYVKDQRAHALRAQRRHTVGLLVRAAQHSFYGELVTAMQTELALLGLPLVIGNDYGAGESPTAALDDLVGMRVSALVVASSRIPDTELRELAQRIPVVCSGKKSAHPSVGSVSETPEACAALADLVIEAGHHRVGLLHVSPELSHTRAQRMTTLETELTARGVTPVRIADSSTDNVRAAHRDGVTVIMCANDPALMSVWESAQQLNLEVPTDLSLTGFDGVGELATPILGLTTWRRRLDTEATLIGQQIYALLAGEPAQQLFAPGELILGRTLANLNSRSG